MYIIKNAFRCISRSVGRNLLIGIIVLVIAVSACLGLSIRQAAESARAEALSGMVVTATISFDRQSAMENMRPPTGGEGGDRGSFDRDQFSQMMGSSSGLTLEEYQKYATAESVEDFYYSVSVSLNGNDDVKPVSNEAEEEEDDTTSSNKGNGFGGMGGMGFPGGGFGAIRGAASDFKVVGYSSEKAMTAFQEGTASITDGAVFTEGTAEMQCIISSELAAYNTLAVGDTITLANPNKEEETYTLTVVGIYTDSSANEQSFSMMGSTSTDPANQIYMSHAALQTIVDASAEANETVKDEDTGRSYETALKTDLSGTYVFAAPEDYELFEQQVRDLGLDDSYTVTSSDIAAFEQSLVPLDNLSSMAQVYLIVILIIGAIILVVLNIFNVRERKYEIGVLTAMGMKKWKVSTQFLTEIFAVTLAAVIIGVGVGAVFSVPVTNALLADQIASQNSSASNREEAFGRPGGDGGFGGGMGGMTPPGMGGSGGGFGDMSQMFGEDFVTMFGGDASTAYVTSVSSAMNLTVVFQMLGIALLLTVVSGIVSMLFVMRYEPLKILANRD